LGPPEMAMPILLIPSLRLQRYKNEHQILCQAQAH
jgi:hypothetical protein